MEDGKGKRPYVVDIEKLTTMTIEIGGEVGLEIHKDTAPPSCRNRA